VLARSTDPKEDFFHTQSGLADAELPADIRDRGACLRLAERVGGVLLREVRPLDPVPSLRG